MEVKGYAASSVDFRRKALGGFFAWCDERAVGRPEDVTKPMIERWQRSLFLHRKADGQPMSFRRQAALASVVRQHFKWLTRQNVLLSNPASEIELPRVEMRLPQAVLTVDEAERVLAVPDVATTMGLRDRAMLEVLYGTGIRRGELVRLSIWDLDVARRVLRVQQGKGRKDRYVPIGERALAWVERYRREARPLLVSGADDGVLFRSAEGQPLPAARATHLASEVVEAAGVGKPGACHLFRHTMATLMLENGADVRALQEMLGHAKLETTAIDTHVSLTHLQKVHETTHPGAALRRTKPMETDAVEERADTEELVATLAEESGEERVDERTARGTKRFRQVTKKAT